MKRKDIIRLLVKAGWTIVPGSKHDLAKNSMYPGTKIPIPRHIEINEYTAVGILKAAGIDPAKGGRK